MTAPAPQTPPASSPSFGAVPPGAPAPPFGVNEMRLSARQWLIAFAIVIVCAVLVPRLWKKFEPFPTGDDYRIPYALSGDYWLYQRRLEQDLRPGRIPVLGDSVVWGEYVRPDGTLTHFLSRQSGRPDRFVNCGVNGLFPLALEGLVESCGSALHDRKVIVQCNLLWMSSPKADLRTAKQESINHSRLVPQYPGRVPAYAADAHERIGATLERHVGFFAWVNHLQDSYYNHRSLPRWTLEEDDDEPPGYPNGWRSPLGPIRAGIPGEPARDRQRGPDSPRHRPWDADGAEPTHFEWVGADFSLQWRAFQRVIRLLRSRNNDVLVILGPFNEHMIARDQRPEYRAVRDRVAAWLVRQNVPVVVPEALPSHLYADASHPLTEGYALLAERVWREAAFQEWLSEGGAR